MRAANDEAVSKVVRHSASNRLRSLVCDALAARRKDLLIASLVFVGGLALSLVASLWVAEQTRELAQSRLDTASSNAAAQVEMRFAAYVGVLAGVRALFHTRDTSREDFRRFAEALALKRDYPGFQVLNYAPYVSAGSREAFEESVRRDPSWPAQVRFVISPSGIRDGYHPIAMIEPLADNEQFLGRDLAAVPAARVALEVARDTGKLTSSGKLIQPRGPGKQVGLAMRMPVYRAAMPIETFAQRRAAYVGSVGAGFHIAEMLANLPGVTQGVRVRLYEGGPEPIVKQAGDVPVPEADKLLFDTADPDGRRQPIDETRPQERNARNDIHRVQWFTLADRVWLVEVSAPFTERVRFLDRTLPAIILITGIVISATLATVLLNLPGARGTRTGRSTP